MDSDLGKCWTCKKRGKLHCEICNFALYCSERCQTIDSFRHLVECKAVQNIRTCRSCHKNGKSLLKCGSCYTAYYCSPSCQKQNWPSHKAYCKEFLKNVLKNTLLLQKPYGDLPWYIGMTLAEDFLRLRQNEGTDTKKDFNLLFAGIGDMRHIFRTVADLPRTFKGRLHFVLNDIGPHVSARNLLFLYCAIVDKPDASYLVQMWYSLYLTAAVLKYLVAKLKELVTQSHGSTLTKMQNLVQISEEHWNKCVEIWRGWYKLALDPDAAQRMMEVRHKKLDAIIDRLYSSFQLLPAQHHWSRRAVGVHCWMGRGRTGVMLACYMVRFYDMAPEKAITHIRKMRPASIETYEQERAVVAYNDYLCSI